VTVATSWDATGSTPAVVRYGEGLTLAVVFTDRSTVERVEVDASAIGRSSRFVLSDLHESSGFSRGTVARVPPRFAGRLLHLPFRARLAAGAVLEGTIPVTVSRERTLVEDFDRLLALPDVPPRPSDRASARTYWRQCTIALDSCWQLLDLKGGERVLEVGAGSAWASRRFADHGCHVVALDINPENLATATNYLYLTEVYFERVLADAETLPFADASFDVVFGCAVLHHAASMPRLLAELKRVLAPDGRLVLLNETLRPVTQSEEEALAFSPHELAAGVNEHAPTVLEYSRAFRSSGLRCTASRTDYLDPWFREEVLGENQDSSRLARVRHWLARRRWSRRMSERISLLLEGGAVSFVASHPTRAPGRLPARQPQADELRRVVAESRTLRDTIAQLETAKSWLEQHARAQVDEIQRLVDEGAGLRDAIAQLEQGQGWLREHAQAQAAEIERLTTQMAGLREAIAQLEEGKAWLKELSEARADEIERWRLEHERLRAWTLDRERAVSELMAQAESRGRQS